MIGPGDDTFVAKLPPGLLLAATKDLLVENVHFRLDWITPEQLGYKAMAENLSDLAAMGACIPLYALIGLAMPGDTPVDFVDKLYTGMNKIGKKNKLIIAGGDIVSTKKDIVISITLIGGIKKEHVVTRSGAEAGDKIFVTGTFGDSGAGLKILEKGMKKHSRAEKYLINRHLMPEPRMKEAEIISRNKLATSMIDSSDGLAASLKFIAQASGTGADVDLDRVPVSKQLSSMPEKSLKAGYIGLALNGGEDYELVFTVKPGKFNLVKKLVPGASYIGEITKTGGVKYFKNGLQVKINAGGYQHFL